MSPGGPRTPFEHRQHGSFKHLWTLRMNLSPCLFPHCEIPSQPGSEEVFTLNPAAPFNPFNPLGPLSPWKNTASHWQGRRYSGFINMVIMKQQLPLAPRVLSSLFHLWFLPPPVDVAVQGSINAIWTWATLRYNLIMHDHTGLTLGPGSPTLP